MTSKWHEILWVPFAWSIAAGCALSLIQGNGDLARVVVLVLLGSLFLSLGMGGVNWLRAHRTPKLVAAWAVMCGIGWFAWSPTTHHEIVAVTPSLRTTPPGPSVPLVKTPKLTSQLTQSPKPNVKIEQHGVGSGAVGGSITQGPCSNLQIGGQNNQASTNCAPPDPTLLAAIEEATSLVNRMTETLVIDYQEQATWFSRLPSGPTTSSTKLSVAQVHLNGIVDGFDREYRETYEPQVKNVYPKLMGHLKSVPPVWGGLPRDEKYDRKFLGGGPGLGEDKVYDLCRLLTEVQKENNLPSTCSVAAIFDRLTAAKRRPPQEASARQTAP